MSIVSRRHHYVPQFYLRAFEVTVGGKGPGFWVYDKRSPVSARFQTPANTAVQGHFYSFKNATGQTDDSIERMLAAVEGAALPS